MRERCKTSRLLRGLWLLAAVAVVIGSLLPGGSPPMLMLARLHISDKIQHFGAYALLAFLPAIHEQRKFILVAALGAVALGVVLEFDQRYAPGRTFEIADMLANTTGV